MRIDAVVPLALPDLDRFQILRASIAQFWECEGAINMVVRDQDEAAIAAVVGDDNRYHVLRESTIAPILAECDTGDGWYRQQLIKLAIAAFKGGPMGHRICSRRIDCKGGPLPEDWV